LRISMSIRNLLNNNHPGTDHGRHRFSAVGPLQTDLRRPNGEDFLETARNRRLEVQLWLTF
jgi:hypothetical protein